MNASTRLLATLCVSVTISLAMSVFAQTNAPASPRQIAPHLFHIHGDYELPKALIVPAGQAPDYALERLATSECHIDHDERVLAQCARYFISREPIVIRQLVLKEKANDSYGHSRYEAALADGRRVDIWTTDYGCNYSPDGSKLRVGVIEDRLKDLRSPWGPEPLNNVEYNNWLHPGTMPYLQRVAADGRVLWAYVYLVPTSGYTTDKWDNPVVENPLLGFGEVVCPKGTTTGFLTSSVIRNGKFTFGALAVEIDTYTGQPMVKQPRIRVVPAAEVEQHYRLALAELIEEGEITEKDTHITTERFRDKLPPSRYLDKDYEFSERLQRNLLKTYFTDIQQGTRK